MPVAKIADVAQPVERIPEDLFVVISRRLIYVGLFFRPLLKFRLGTALNLSDGILLVSGILLLLSRQPPPRAPATPAWYVGVFIFLLSGVASSIDAYSHAASLEVVVNSIFLLIVVQWLLRQQLNNPGRIRRAMCATVLGCALSAFVAFLQETLHIFLPSQAAINASIGGTRAVGLTSQPNLAGVTFALGLIFGVGIVLEYGFRRYWYIAACAGLCGIAVILAGSLTGMSGVVAGLIVLIFARGFELRRVVPVIVAVALIYILALVALGGAASKLNPVARFQATTTAGSGSDTVSVRIDTLKNAWTGVQDSPFLGHGLDQISLSVYYDPYLGVFYEPHNIVVFYWYAGGIFMVFGGAIMMGSSFNRLLRGRRSRGPDWDPMKDTVLAACVGVLVFSMGGPELIDRWLWLPFLLAFCFRDPIPAATGAPAAALETPATDEPTERVHPEFAETPEAAPRSEVPALPETSPPDG